MRISLRWKRLGPLDIFAPAMQRGRLRTWICAVLKRPELLRNRAQAWAIYETVSKQIKVSWPLRPTDRLARFAHHISSARHKKPTRYLEIGAFEGASTALVHAILRNDVLITVVDPFAEYVELEDAKMLSAYDRFTANMQAVGAISKVRVLRGRSIDHLPNLIDAGEQFDIVFIDGSHATLDVALDAVLCWKLLAPGGLMIFDDYWYRRPELGNSFRPKLAVDGFVGALSHEVKVLDVASQVFLQKKPSHPPLTTPRSS